MARGVTTNRSPMMIRPLIAAGLISLALALPASAARKPAPPPPVTPAPVVAAERAFAADGLAMGVKQSFLKNMADDAIVFQPDPMNAREAISAQSDAPGPKLEWWPTWAGIASSGDLGFTTGPYAVDGVRRGHYFTIWKRQQDGSWKWLYDGGAGSNAKEAPGPDRNPGYLTLSNQAGRYPEGAFAEAQKAEAVLNAAAAEDATAAYIAALVCEGRIQGSPAAPAQGCASFRDELAMRARQITFSPLGGEASAAGDLAWTYGDAAWTDEGKPRRGHYVRIWQSRAEGWRLVFDQILPAPPRKP
jgi:ketosteroid isomerase-like protein